MPSVEKANAREQKRAKRVAREIPHNLDDFIELDSLEHDTTKSTFTLEDVSDDDELWIMEIPKTLNPHALREQTLLLGEKSKMKIDRKKYSVISNTNDECLATVLNTGRRDKPYKTVSIRPTGRITITSKVSSSRKAPLDEENVKKIVPFPDNVKVRHPYFIDVKTNSKKTSLKRRRDSSD